MIFSNKGFQWTEKPLKRSKNENSMILLKITILPKFGAMNLKNELAFEIFQ